MSTVVDHSQTIFNEDGSVYMTFPPAAPSPADLEGWYVKIVTAGRQAIVETDCVSFNELLTLVNVTARDYGYSVPSSKIADHTFRWTWERRLPSGVRLTDMIIASKIA